MKKTLLIIACFISSFSFAQLPPNSLGADFTVTDILGEEHNLYEILDEGKTVILDLFAVWCGPCWSFAETGVLEDLQNQYPDDVVCLAIEADASTSESDIYGGGNSVGDWTTIIDYIMADDPTGDIANDYALAYYPTIYKICPDRMVTEVGQLSSVNAFMNEVNSCTQATYSKDMKMIGFDGVNAHCNGTANPSVKVQNYSLDSNVTEFNIRTLDGDETLSLTEWSGDLSTYEVATIQLQQISGLSGTTNLTFEIEYTGDQDSSNDDDSATLSGVSEQSSADVTLHIETDGWGYETSFELIDFGGNVIESVDGTLANESTYDWEWSLGEGCYVFNIYDSYGDGVAGEQWGSIDGVVTLEDANNGVLWEGVDFGEGASLAFEVSAALDIEEGMDNTVKIYPNPSTDYTNLELYLANNENVNLKIYNSLGQIVQAVEKGLMPSGNHNIKIDVDNLVEGLYFIELHLGNSIELHSINIVK